MMDEAVAQGYIEAHQMLMSCSENHAEHVKLHAEMVQSYYDSIAALKFPADRKKITRLSFEEKQWWWMTAHQSGFADTILEGKGSEFDRFWFWTYLFPTRIKRISLYLLKPYLLLKRIRQRDSKAEQDLLKRMQERNKERNKIL